MKLEQFTQGCFLFSEKSFDQNFFFSSKDFVPFIRFSKLGSRKKKKNISNETGLDTIVY